jgi:hypothetical protein
MLDEGEVAYFRLSGKFLDHKQTCGSQRCGVEMNAPRALE